MFCNAVSCKFELHP